MHRSAPYHAISAKVHALYGRRMKPEDYRQLLSKKNVREAAAFLQNHPGYAARLSGLSTNSIHRETLENALRGTYVDEYRRIFSFLNLSDKALMLFPMYRAEQSAILTSMRHLTSTSMLEPALTWDPVLKKQSRLDLAALARAETFSDIAAAARDTIYGSALERVDTSDGKTPTHAFVDNMMQVAYYARLYQILSRNYSGQTKQLIKQALDDETDLLNLVQFLRLKRHFPAEDIQLYSFPLPCTAKLSRSYIQELIAAPDYDAALQLVLSGPYASLFRSITPSGLEAYLYTLQYHFSRRQLRAGSPTIYTPIAYLTLKEIELRNIISIIECIRYDVDPHSFVTLIGAS